MPLTETASKQSCYVCGAKPSEMNNLDKVRGRPTSERAINLGIPCLHYWMKGFGNILHLGDKMANKAHKAAKRRTCQLT